MAYRPNYLNVLAVLFFGFSILFLSNQEPIQRIFKASSPATVPEAFTQEKPAILRKESTTILVLGDMMLDRFVRSIIEKQGIEYLFSDVATQIQEADLSLVNAEGPFTDYESQREALRKGSLTFTFATSTLPSLREFGFDLFGLANNHTLNFGTDGLLQTKKYLSQNDIEYFGDPSNKSGESVFVSFGSTSVAFVGYHAFAAGAERILEEIKRLDTRNDFVFVFPHWGTEYQPAPGNTERAMARRFIDAGADAIFGTHPHVVQTMEFYKEKAIFYSLGNFIFDQYFSEETQEGLGVVIHINNKVLSYELLPLVSVQSKPSFLLGDAKDFWIERFFNRSLLREDEKTRFFTK